jgi:deoxyribonuclease V
VIGVVKSRFRTATHAVPIAPGSSVRVVRHCGRDAPRHAADLVRRMAGRYRLRDALRRTDTLARADPPAATMTGRKPD